MIVMTQCSKCKKEVYMPFICNYCQASFCSDHRLPENHGCKNIGAASAPHARPTTHQVTPPEPEIVSSQSQQVSSEEWQPTPGAEVERYFEPDGTEVIVERIPIYNIQRPEKPIFKYFSTLELKHLAIGLVLMFGVGISMFISMALFLGGAWYEWWVYLALAGLATIAFIIHEFGHKFVGIKLGNWSEFRLIKIFAILTAISLIPIPFFKIVCPGAVQVTGDTSPTNMGKIAFAGPFTNLIQAVLFVVLAFSIVSTTDILFMILMTAAYLNSFLGLFNLIPLGPLDGLKVIRWSKPLYFILVILLVVSLIIVLVNF